MAETSTEEVLNEKSFCDMYSNYEDSEVKEALDEMVDTVSEGTSYSKDNGVNAIPSTDISRFVEMEDSSAVPKGDREKVKSFSKQRSSKSVRRTRSISENESEEDTKPKEIIRRKFGSEGAVLSIGKNIHPNIIPPEQQKEVSEAVEQYIDKLIKESIYKAVQNVNVESLCEGIIKNISNRKNSLNVESENDFVVEHLLHSKSISELTEFENAFNKERDKSVECNGLLFQNDNGVISEIESFYSGLDDGDQASFAGYLADLEDTAGVDDLKSAEESLNSSMSSSLDRKDISRTVREENGEMSNENVNQTESTQTIEFKNSEVVSDESVDHVTEPNSEECLIKDDPKGKIGDQQQSISSSNSICEQTLKLTKSSDKLKQNLNQPQTELNVTSQETLCEQEQKLSSENCPELSVTLSSPKVANDSKTKLDSSGTINETQDLIKMSSEEDNLLPAKDSKAEESSIPPPDITDTLPQQNEPSEDQKKVNWKVGYLHVKLPHKTRGKTHLKAWKKRRVIIQPDEFVNDPKNPSLVISVYGVDSKKHETTFWHSVSGLKAVVFRSSSRTHKYAFTISDGGEPIIHLSSDRETTTQEWMAAIRAVLWPPSPFMELEKMLSGREFEISIIDNEFSFHAGLLGMYGYLSITPKKLILLHPQQGYVIQEWYLNTVDKFQFVPQPKADDDHKVLCMTTCRDSSTGQGDLIFFCNEAVTLLQSLASNIHQVLSYHSKQEGGKYQKELEEIAEWLVAPPQDCLNIDPTTDEHYKVPPRQVKSLLDIPNFIFNKSLSPVASAIYPAPNSNILEPLDGTKNKPVTTSHDSGISTCTSNEDFLNCSAASFIIGGGPLTGRSSDSELSDTYTPPRTPEISKKTRCEVLKEEQVPIGDA